MVRVPRSNSRVLEVILIAVATAAVVFELVPLALGPAGLGVVGDSSGAIIVDAGLDTRVVIPDALRHDDGTVRTGTASHPAELIAPYSATARILDPTPFDRTLYIVSRAAAPLLGLVVVGLLLGVVRAVRDGDPFTRASARRLTLLAGTVAAGGLGVNVLREMADNILLARTILSSVVALDATLSFIPLAAGAAIAALAEAFRHGARLREDVEGLV